jgi:hypothetical protein
MSVVAYIQHPTRLIGLSQPRHEMDRRTGQDLQDIATPCQLSGLVDRNLLLLALMLFQILGISLFCRRVGQFLGLDP